MPLLIPRGIRNNNPGNIRYSEANHWQGRAEWSQRTEEQRLEREFEVFAAPEWGIRAMAVLLITYFDRDGLSTVAKIIGKWAPPSENNTASYILSVAHHMGANPTVPLNLHSYDELRPLVVGIIAHENGAVPYSDAVIDKGLALAGLVAPMKPLTHSRTIAGAAVTATSTIASVGEELTKSVAEVREVVESTGISLPTLQLVFAGLAVLGVLLTIWARVSDNARRVT